MDVKAALDIDFECYNERIQRDQHQKQASDHSISSRFHETYGRSTWYGRTEYVPMNSTPLDNGISYTVDPRFDLLIASEMDMYLPMIEVTDPERYRVSWTDEFYINAIPEGELRQKTLMVSRLDDFTQDVDKNFMGDMAFRPINEEAIGNIDELIGFHSMLPEKKVSYNPPFMYNWDPIMRYPILFNNGSPDTIHFFRFMLKINKLLKVEEYIDGTWVLGNIQQHHIKQPIDMSIPTPILKGMYVRLSPPEKLKYIKDCKDDGDFKIIRFKEYVRLDKNDDNNLYGINDPYSIKIITDMPCHALFWAAENRIAEEYNDRSNYTLNKSDSRNGTNPISSYAIHYGKNIKTRDDNNNRCRSQCRLHYPSYPVRNGFGTICHSWYPKTCGHSDNSIMYPIEKDAVLSLVIDDPNMKKKKIEDGGKKSVKFLKIKVCALVDRKLSITKTGDSYTFEINKYD